MKTNINLNGQYLFSVESDWSADSLAAWFAGFGESWSLLGGEGDLASWYCDRLNRISFGEADQWLDRMVALSWWVAENGEPGPEIDLIDCIKPETLH
ncbi:hypothetical protein CGI80_13510 [Vibrio parahaemolyticus]|uniref:hypothetical protein n=1 Tax=Vibrio parahaemolyticus TaxID=670 RepID=UPI001124182A|nr:hypothetical protein [Vibrio parahaemolyticus]TOH49874.1 hypothetical protein CGI80_13510 [Vibrio parahaemolyticus]